MLKDILLKTAEIINRDDLIDGLNNSNNSPSIKNDIIRLISYYNYTLETLTDNYFNLVNKQTIQSNNNKQINIINFILTTNNYEGVLPTQLYLQLSLPSEPLKHLLHQLMD